MINNFRFIMDPTNGSLFVDDALDYENQPRISFTVIARDGAGIDTLQASTNITISLRDINDNPPAFINLPALTSIFENESRVELYKVEVRNVHLLFCLQLIKSLLLENQCYKILPESISG